MPTQKGSFRSSEKRRNMAPLNTKLGTVGRRPPGSREKPVISLVWSEESPIPAGFSNPWLEEAVLPKRLSGGLEPHQHGGWLRPQVLKQDRRVLP